MSGSHLTISRINRVLRPLRTKCDKLASGTKSSSGVQITYSTRTRARASSNANSAFSEGAPPLAILQPPDTLRTKPQLDTDNKRHLELSGNIYAVRDAFKNVVQVAFGSGAHSGDRRSSLIPSGPCSSRILSLSALCGVVVGRELGTYDPEDDKNEEGSDVEEIREGFWVDEIYEEIPLHNRKWALVTHALQLVLRICPHHPTLLASLLDLCLSHPQQQPLIPHCQVLLKALLKVSFTSPSNPNAVTQVPPPICHTAHVPYLVDLKKRWCSTGFGNERNFVGLLLQSLSDASPEAWTSKAVARLAHDVSNTDKACLVYLATDLLNVFSCSRSRSEWRPNGRKVGLLTAWCHSILDHLMFASGVEDDSDVCLAVLDLTNAYFEFRRPFQSPSAELEDLMTCMVTWCLASLPPAFSEQDLIFETDTLAALYPSGSIYSPLIARIFSLSTGDELSDKSINEIRAFTASLRYNGLFRLEASFISQTLPRFEKLFMAGYGHEPDFEEVRGELIQKLAEVEATIRRVDRKRPNSEVLDKVEPADDNAQLSSPSPSQKKKRRRMDSEDEDYLPVRKRLKHNDRKAPSTPIAKPKLGRLERKKTSRSKYDEEYLTTSVGKKRLVRKAIFYESDRTPEMEPDGQEDGEEGESGQSDESGDESEEEFRIDLSSRRTFSSDDLLDLFAIPNTSPVVVCRRRR